MSRLTHIGILLVVLLGTITVACKRTTKTTHSEHSDEKVQYTCPMHPQIVRDAPGSCPICGMDLVRKETKARKHTDITLTTLLKPTNEYVIATIPTTTVQYRYEPMEIDAVGYTAYNTSSIGIISSRITGRVERLYVKYKYQHVSKGQKIMDVYSPELLTAQENLLFLVKNDRSNQSLINSAKQRLLLLGMSQAQINSIITARKTIFRVAVFSNYSGHIHETQVENASMGSSSQGTEMSQRQITDELSLKEGMYVEKGKAIFSIFDQSRLWGVLNIYPADQPYIRIGHSVRVTPESAPANDFRTTIKYIEPFFREGSQTVTARIDIPNVGHAIPVGSQLKATIFTQPHAGWWLPKASVLSLGIDKIVFVKKGPGFAVQKIVTGHEHPNWIQIVEGVDARDSIATNAQYLIDSESFIEIENEQ
ncbi:efflux RND transporter periplasmic adaptor subunit [Polluticoccus soli]|uniref:efflux RND transporter periplasmic adaptor subunit n=1 Tax=Polluticoccus soli TaxID=3034150 RepID=UPI0023E34989|nr:efflux RND transporter periplasmic adaptor subunit [Flavipsychrobacter sp. JY13-12]